MPGVGYTFRGYISCPHAVEGKVLFSAKLLGTTSDIPAIRKICGHLGIHAAQGCHKCKRSFKKINKCTDFSGFDFNNWTLRTNSDHCVVAMKHFKASTRKKERILKLLLV